MNIYSHAVLANSLGGTGRPIDDDYIWGAVAPDIRYLAGMPRSQTHLPAAQISSWFQRFPEFQSFIEGYQVHCRIDEIDLMRVVTKTFPLRLMRPVLSQILRPRRLAVAIELYYHHAYPAGLSLSGSFNPILAELGITPGQSTEFSGALQEYVRSPSFETATTAFARLGIIDDTRIEKYAAEYRLLQNNPFFLSTLLKGIRNANLEKVAATVAARRSRNGKPNSSD